jgi:hypothetical protein
LVNVTPDPAYLYPALDNAMDFVVIGRASHSQSPYTLVAHHLLCRADADAAADKSAGVVAWIEGWAMGNFDCWMALIVGAI